MFGKGGIEGWKKCENWKCGRNWNLHMCSFLKSSHSKLGSIRYREPIIGDLYLRNVLFRQTS